MKNAPCYNCENRSVGCHSQCEAYSEYDRKRKAVLAMNRKKRIEDRSVADVNFRLLHKRKKRKDQYV